VPQVIWARLVGTPETGPPLPGFWWESLTPLAADCELALEKFHCSVSDYYARTTWQVRLLHRLAVAYRQEQDRHARELDEERQEAQREAQAQARQMHG
jgi:hypothetical protein